MELNLAGTEVHELRETLETVLSGIEKEIAGLKDPEALKEVKKRKETLRSILDKFPTGLIEVG